MGFWDELTGSSQAGRIEDAGNAARSELGSGYGRAPGGSSQGALQRGRDRVNNLYGNARGAVHAGQQRSITSLRGGQQGALDANQMALGAVQGGTGQAVGSVNQGVDTARGDLNPYAQGGGSANQMFLNAIGAGGQGAQQQYVDAYQADPSQQYVQQQIERQMNARGMTDSGAAALASARAHNEGYNQRLAMLQGAGAQGLQAAGQMGNYAFQGGATAAGFEDAGGSRAAAVYGDRGNIYGQAGRDMASVYGNSAANVANSFTGQAGLENQSFTNSANLQTNLTDALAAEHIQRANGVNSAYGQGVNNMLSGLGNIAGTAISGFAPGANGVSPIGNMSTAFRGIG